MSPLLIALCVSIYFGILLTISYFTSKNANSDSYFNGNKSSPWYVVAFGMLGDSLSGVTFISVPGAIIAAKFGYLQLVYGYFFGYLIIIFLLLPLYYKLNLTSIYSYLFERYGRYTQYTGSFFFILSRILGSAARLYLAASVIQLFIFDQLNIPFAFTVSFIIFLIWLYTVKGGIKTLVWTDTFQSLLLILGVVFSIVSISQSLNIGLLDVINIVKTDDLSTTFNWDVFHKNYFWKQFLGGIFIATCMTGLDQNMMQKNLSCKTLGESQKNMFWFSVIMVITNIFFLSLGVLLYYYATQKGIELPIKPDGSIDSDKVFPFLALKHLGLLAGISFIVGLTAATFSSADSVLTTLTTSFYIDILHENPENKSPKLRRWIHIGFAILLLIVILIIKYLNTSAVIDITLKIANFTYGPLLGLFLFGMFTKRKVNDLWIPIVCIIAPIIAFWIDSTPIIIGNNTFFFGNTMLLINGIITFMGLFLVSFFSSRKTSN